MSNLNEIEVAAYMRVSTTKQRDDGNGIEAQRLGIESFCRNNNHTITEWYVDGACSRVNLQRPACQKMLKDISKKK